MSKSTFKFEVFDDKGQLVKQASQRCDNVTAQERTIDFLETTIGAVAAFGIEAHGHQVHSAYRD